MNKSKIYLGPANTANIFQEMEKALRKVGLKADFVPWSTSQHSFYHLTSKTFKLFNNPTFKLFGKNVFTIINTWFLEPMYFLFALLKYNTFFFIKPVTFFRSNMDLSILKFFNKKIVFFYVGCNDRNPLFSDAKDYVCNICYDEKKKSDNNCNNLDVKKAKSHYFEKYATKVFGFRDNIDYLKGEGNRLALGMGDIIIPSSQKNYNNKLKILHLPSNPLVKGTSIIEPILLRIAEEEDVEVVIKKDNWSFEKMVDAMKEGHILIDSLAVYTFGKLSLEAIQYGCLPLNAYPDWIAKYYDIPPVVKVDKDTLYHTLKELIADRALLEKKMAQSQNAFNKYFTYEAVGNYYKEKLNLQ